MEPSIALGEVAAAGMHLGHMFLPGHRYSYPSADRIPVASLPCYLNCDPVAALALVQQDRGRAFHIVDNDVHSAVAVQVGEGGSAADSQDFGQRLFADFGELAIAGLYE